MDELNKYLKTEYPSYLVGKEDCNLLLWGTNKADMESFRLCTLILGTEYDPVNADKKTLVGYFNNRYNGDETFRNLLRFGQYISDKLGCAFLTIGYPSMRQNYNSEWESTSYKPAEVYFLVKDNKVAGIQSEMMTGEKLRQELYSRIGTECTDEGTSKEKNVRLADFFHYWSREYLTKNIVKVDFDGIFNTGAKRMLIEIKRSNIPPIPEWSPYADDLPDYELLRNIAKAIGYDFIVLHHSGKKECNCDSVISLFEMESAPEIVGKYLKCSRAIKEMPLQGEGSLDEYLQDYIGSTEQETRIE